MKGIVPVTMLADRLPEMGRIRMGVRAVSQKGKEYPKSIDKFRLTSPDRAALEEAAVLYGGTVQPWREPKANPPDQWQLITTANTLDVLLPDYEGALSTFYELWGGGGVIRRCDGVTVEVAGQDGMEQAPCICDAKQRLDCKPTTRLNVILPRVRFGGVWRLETHSWNAAHEMPAMETVLAEMQVRGIKRAALVLDRREDMKGGQKRHYVVPRLMLDMSVELALTGAASVAALQAGNLPALPAGSSPPANPGTEPGVGTEPGSEPADGDSQMTREGTDWFDADDEIIDAEIVEEQGGDDEPAPAVDAPAAAAPPPSSREPDQSPAAKALRRTLGAATKRIAHDTLDGDALRHAVIRVVTKGEIERSTLATRKELEQAVLIIGQVLDGTRTVKVWPDGKVSFPTAAAS